MTDAPKPTSQGGASGNPTVDVQQYGQSLWYDNITRDMLKNGELQRMLNEYGILGMTSNPTIFEKAVGESQLYDASIGTLLDLDANEIFDHLSIEDIQGAADLLKPIFDRTDGVDGYVSLEVSPNYANDVETTLSEARRLFAAVDRPNVMIKIPGTTAGLQAIEEALYHGVNINVTLLFSVQNYIEVAKRYISALERRHAEGLPVDKIASVASFFLSRIDTLIDKQLENNIRAAQGRDLDRVSANTQLLGKAAIANAKVAYKYFKDLFYGETFAKLKQAGAKVQRPLWASTGTKNPKYPDTLYMDALIGQDTVNTVPHATLMAFKDHGTAAPTLDTELDNAQSILDQLAEVGIELDRVTQQLQDDGVEAFVNSFKSLIGRVEGKRKTLLSGFMQRQELHLGEYEAAVMKELKNRRDLMSITRTWKHDASLWKDTPDAVKSIESRLGWLTIASDGRIDRARLNALRDESKTVGFKHVVLLGMGGSSLAPEVLARTFGVQEGYPSLLVLDSTDPAHIGWIEQTIDLRTTVFIVASKSGGTLETLSMQRYFFEKVKQAGIEEPGSHFIAITDPGSKLEGWAKDDNYRHIFLNPDDIGGRYSALSYFGMVPAALLGLDTDKLLDRGAEMQNASSQGVTGNNHPALWLGTIMGVMWKHGRDKVTLLSSPEISSYGDWAEQLIAESTGKEGKGIVPVTGATIGMPHDYSDDRLFVYLRLDDSTDNPDAQVKALHEAGHPLVTLMLRDKYDLGAEFFRWEFATAVAGMILEINPFDEPNVTESKNNTNRLLDIFQSEGSLPASEPFAENDQVALYADEKTAALLNGLVAQYNYSVEGVPALIAAHLGLAHSGDYVAYLAYLARSPQHYEALENIQRKTRHTFKRAVTTGFGPRFLHSTGQLHKGGANNGVFVQITTDDQNDPQIPGAPYGFSTLKQAQAAGDLESLQSKDRRAIRIHLKGSDTSAGFDQVVRAIEAAAEKRA